MNKIININLGGVPFIIDEDAYEHVNKYLASIRKHFSKSEGCEEILYDIEVRMAELFLEKLKSRQIISSVELNSVIEIMGKPEDFGAEPIQEAANQTKSKPGADYKYIKTGRRLFRDEDEKIIGGVCSGISAYFGINDPVWIRILFALIAVAGGFGVLAYLALLIIIPKAKTASDRLAMRGEPINVENIAKTIEEEIDEISKKISDFGDELSSKKKDSTVRDHSSSYTSTPNQSEVEKDDHNVNENFYEKRSSSSHFISSIVDGTATIGRWSIKTFISIIIFTIIVSMVLFWSSGLLGYILAFPIFRFFGSSSDAVYTMGSIGLALVILLPIMSLILMLTRWFVPGAPKNEYKGLITLLWILSFGFMTFAAAKTTKEYKNQYQSSNRIEISSSYNQISLSIADIDTKIITLDEDNDLIPKIHLGDDYYATKDRMLVRNVDVRLEKSVDDKFYIIEKLSARGKSRDEAKLKADVLSNKVVLENDKLSLPGFMTYEVGKYFRGEKFDYTIYIPQGKSLITNTDIAHTYINGSSTIHMQDDGTKVIYTVVD